MKILIFGLNLSFVTFVIEQYDFWLSKHAHLKIQSIRNFWISLILYNVQRQRQYNSIFHPILTDYKTDKILLTNSYQQNIALLKSKYLLSFWNHFPNKSQSKRISFSIEDKFTRYRRIHVNCLCQRKISLRSFAVVLVCDINWKWSWNS